MKNMLIAASVSILLALGVCPAIAENVADSDKLICSAGRVMICVEDGECYPANPVDLGMPQFVIIDTKKKMISTTKASGENRTSAVKQLSRLDGRIYLQGVDNHRAFSFVIEEDSGLLTVAIAHDGVAISVFGACTDAEID